jgi:hypothetical protein
MLMMTLRLLLPQAALLRRLILNPLTEENPHLSHPTSILSPPRPCPPPDVYRFRNSMAPHPPDGSALRPAARRAIPFPVSALGLLVSMALSSAQAALFYSASTANATSPLWAPSSLPLYKETLIS